MRSICIIIFVHVLGVFPQIIKPLPLNSKKQKGDLQVSSSTDDKKRFAKPNHRCPECVILRRKIDSWASSSCRDCSYFPKYFNGFLLLEIAMKLRQLGKDYLTLHKEVQHIFEGLISLDKRVGKEVQTKEVQQDPISSVDPMDG